MMLLVGLAAFIVYASGRFAPPPVVEITLQNTFSKTIVAVADKDYWPFTFEDKNGKPSGHDIELLYIIANRIGVNVNLKLLDWEEALAAAKNGEADIVLTCEYGDKESQESSLIMTTATEYGDFVAFGKKRIDSVDELYSKQIGLLKNDNVFMALHRQGLDGHCTYYTSNDEAINGVIKGECDYAVMRYVIGLGIIKDMGKAASGIKAATKIGESNMCIGVASNQQELADQINSMIVAIKLDGTLKRLNRKWLTSYVRPFTVAEIIAENIWIVPVLMFAAAVIVYLLLTQNSLKRNHQQQLEKALVLAQAANRAKTRFLNNMSHDIRTPMNSILSMNEMVLRECDDEDILVYAEHIRSSGNTLLGLISDILDFSKIEAGKMEILPVDYELSSVLNDLVNMLQTRAEEKGLHIELSVDSSMPNYLNGDEIRIKQATTNLLTNAVKYTKEGTITFSMGYDEIEGEPDQIMLNVSVKDTGAGIREEDIGKLFEAFERLDESGNRNIEGTGLGITITQRLLMMMGSTLKVESEYGKGSVFSFSVRQKVCSHEPVGDFEQAFRRYVADRKRYKEKFTAPDARILVVDDMQENLTVVRNLLKRTKIRIDTAESGDECIKLASEKKYDLIFLDHMMPGKDGIETLKELKGLEHNPNHDTPKVCLTANAISGMRENYIAAGFDDYITKPVNPDRLEETIMHFLPDNLIEPPDEPSGADEGIEIPEFIYGIEGLDAEAGSKHCGSPENYLDALMSYQERVARNAEEIEGFWQDKDIRSLTVKIHGIKSTSRAIGAAGLGNTAEMLENAGNAEDVQLLEDKLDDFLTMYRALGDALSPLVKENGDDADKPLMDMEELNGIYRSLKKHAANYDYDDIAELGDYLEGFRVPDEEADKVRKIREAISEMDYDIIPELLG